jgi:hypothetical protein
MMTIFRNILKFITDPKNTRMLLLGAIVVLLLLFLRQCNATKAAKAEVELQKQETVRISNNYDAAMDTIRKTKIDDNTWRSEKLGYELTLDELKGKYASLLGDFKIEKNRPPKTIIKTEFIIKETINNVPVLVGIDGVGNTFLTFNDSTYHDSINYRLLSGKIPYKLVLDPVDSLYKLVPDNGQFSLAIGMNLNLGLFQDKKTKKISILADTNYPGVTFTTLEGASIMDDPANKKILRSMRKTWSLGLSVGYGAAVNVKTGGIFTGPYVGFGINYSPKFLQWGK